jgi:DNA-binding MarR family transcriptional regulator
MPEMSETDPCERHPGAREAVGDRFGFLFAKMHARSAKLSMDVLQEAGLGLTGMHLGALTMIEEAGPMSQNAVGAALGKDRTTMVSVVDDLERAGLVERRRNPQDRRAYALEATAEGRTWQARAIAALKEAEGELLGGLTPEERETLRGLLQRLVFDAPAPVA